MSPTAARGGRGSNQYQTRGTPTAVARAEMAAVPAGDLDSELVAMSFDQPVNDWRAAGLTDPEIITWYHAGHSLGSAIRWMAVGATDPKVGDGFLVPDVLAPWQDAGCVTDEAMHWKASGLRAVPDAIPWAIHGDTPDEADCWRVEGFASPAEVDWYAKREGLHPPFDRRDKHVLAARLKDALYGNGFTTDPEATGWTGCLAAARENGVVDPQELCRWRDEFSSGLFFVDEMNPLFRSGVPPVYASAVCTQARHEWGITAGTAKWLIDATRNLWTAGVTDPDTAMEFMRDQVGSVEPEAVLPWLAADLPVRDPTWDDRLSGTPAHRASAAAWWHTRGYSSETAARWDEFCGGNEDLARRVAGFLDSRGVTPGPLDRYIEGT